MTSQRKATNTVGRNPMRWPVEWNDPSHLELLKGTVINSLLIEAQQSLERVADRARQKGLEVFASASLPRDVMIVPGEWPGIASFFRASLPFPNTPWE